MHSHAQVTTPRFAAIFTNLSNLVCTNRANDCFSHRLCHRVLLYLSYVHISLAFGLRFYRLSRYHTLWIATNTLTSVVTLHNKPCTTWIAEKLRQCCKPLHRTYVKCTRLRRCHTGKSNRVCRCQKTKFNRVNHSVSARSERRSRLRVSLSRRSFSPRLVSYPSSSA